MGLCGFVAMVNAEKEADSVTQDDVLKTAHYYDVKKIVVGHTVVAVFKKVYNGMVIAIVIIQPYKKTGTSSFNRR